MRRPATRPAQSRLLRSGILSFRTAFSFHCSCKVERLIDGGSRRPWSGTVLELEGFEAAERLNGLVVHHVLDRRDDDAVLA